MSKYKNTSKTSKGMKGGDNSPAEFVSGNQLINAKGAFDHIQPIQAKHLEVAVYGGNLEKALRIFRQKVQKEGTLAIYKSKQYYEKPSDKRRRKKNEMKRKIFEQSKIDPSKVETAIE